MKKITFLFSLIIITSLILAACGGGAQPTATEATTGGAKSGANLKVVLLLNGTEGDKSFFDSAARGARQAEKEFGIQLKVIEAGWESTNWQPALEDAAANEDYDIMILGTFQMSEYLQTVAPKYPDKKFILFDVAVDYTACDCKNVYSVTYKQNEGSYLAGLYAGLMTQQTMEGMNPDKVIGVVGGQDIPVIQDFIVGYKQGAKDAGLDPESGVIVQFAGSWDDAAKGKEIALAEYQQSADIVYNVAALAGSGIFQAAQEVGRFAIGVDSDQATIIEATNPDQAKTILTSMLKNVDKSLYRAIKMHIDGTLPYGQAEALGVAEEGVGLARNKFYDSMTPADVKAKIDQAEKDLLAGKIVVDTVFK